MTRDQLCSEIAKRENKKVQISIGNIREVVRILIELQCEFHLDPEAKYNEAPLFILGDEVEKKLKAKEKKKKPKKS